MKSVPASIIIPTYNRLSRLKQVLQTLRDQDVPPGTFEVIVVSDGSTDGTDAYLCDLQPGYPLRAVFQQNQGVAAARNKGIEHARGEIILFVDDDVVPSSDLVRQHLTTHVAVGENIVVLGPMLTPPDYRMQPWVRWEQAMLYKQYEAMRAGKYAPTARQFFTGNTSLARKHLLAAGGFDQRFRRAEDVELAYRLAELGIRFVFQPDAVGYHYAERSFKSWLEIPYTYGQSDVLFWREKHQEWLLPTVWYEFHQRHPLTRLLTQLCLDRPGLSQPTLTILKSWIQLFDRLGWPRGAHLACSSIFNLRYYQGSADQLGGRAAFFEGVREMKSKVPAPAPAGQA